MTPLIALNHPMTEENAKCSKCAGTGQVADSVDGFVTCVGCQGTGKDYASMSSKCGIHGCENQHENHDDDDSGRRLRTDSVAAMVRELPMTSHDTGKRVPSVTFGTNARGGVGLVYFCSDACGACKVFAPTLVAFLKAHVGEVECVAIACDAENSYEKLIAGDGCGMLRVSDGDDAEERARRVSTANAILRRCGVTMLPTLAVINYKTGEVVTTWGRTALTVNPRGALRAWQRGESGLNPFGTIFKQFSDSVTRCAYSGT
jgi:thiol-disulfide isomerase/thioredoxin